MPSQAAVTVCMANFQKRPFPPCPHGSRRSPPPCCASLKACPSTLGLTESDPSATIHRGSSPWRARDFARSRNGCRERGSRGAPANVTPPDLVEKIKNRDGILPHFTPLPTLGSACTRPLAAEKDAAMRTDRWTCQRPPDHHLQRNPRRTAKKNSSRRAAVEQRITSVQCSSAPLGDTNLLSLLPDSV